MAEAFAMSNKLSWCQAVIEDFEKVNAVRKYKSDWKTFLMESAWEDFIKIKGDTFYVPPCTRQRERNLIMCSDAG